MVTTLFTLVRAILYTKLTVYGFRFKRWSRLSMSYEDKGCTSIQSLSNPGFPNLSWKGEYILMVHHGAFRLGS